MPGTTILQFLVVLVSGSVALLADTIHNFSDVLTAVPLCLWWVAAAGFVGFLGNEAVAAYRIRVGQKIGPAGLVVLLWGTVRSIGRRLLDGIAPELLDRAESALAHAPGVLAVSRLQLRWVGHRLQGAATIVVADTVLSSARCVAHEAEDRLVHLLPNLDDMAIRTVTAARPVNAER